MKKSLFLLLAFPLCALSAPQYTWESQGASYTGQIDLGSSSTDGLSGSLSPSYSGINGNNAVQPPVVIVSGAASGGGGSSTGITYTSETCFTSDNLSWTPPAGTTYIEALVVGGGGGASINKGQISGGISGGLVYYQIPYTSGDVKIKIGTGGQSTNGLSTYETKLRGLGAVNGNNGSFNSSFSSEIGGSGGASALYYPSTSVCPGAGCFAANSGGSTQTGYHSSFNMNGAIAGLGFTCDGWGDKNAPKNPPSSYMGTYDGYPTPGYPASRYGESGGINSSCNLPGGNLPSYQIGNGMYSGNLIKADPGFGYGPADSSYRSFFERQFYRYDKPIPEPKNCGLTAPVYGWGGGVLQRHNICQWV